MSRRRSVKSMDDDELDEMLRLANPARTPRDAPLTVRQSAIRESIIAMPDRRKPVRVLALMTAPVAALSAVVMMLFAVFGPVGQQPAAAYGPHPLIYSETHLSAREVVETAQQRLSASSGSPQAAAQRMSRSTSWRLAVQDEGEPQALRFIEPVITELTWHPDLSGTRHVTAGAAVAPDGELVTEQGIEAGTVIDTTRFDPGEYPVSVPDAGSMDETDIRVLLDAYAPLDSGSPAGDAVWALVDVFGEWTLTNEQHAWFLRALLEYPELTVLGTTKDRLGRDVIGLRAGTSAPGETATLLVSTQTGRILGVENAVTSTEHPLAVPAGTVIAYILWEDNT